MVLAAIMFDGLRSRSTIVRHANGSTGEVMHLTPGQIAMLARDWRKPADLAWLERRLGYSLTPIGDE